MCNNVSVQKLCTNYRLEGAVVLHCAITVECSHGRITVKTKVFKNSGSV